MSVQYILADTPSNQVIEAGGKPCSMPMTHGNDSTDAIVRIRNVANEKEIYVKLHSCSQ